MWVIGSRAEELAEARTEVMKRPILALTLEAAEAIVPLIISEIMEPFVVVSARARLS